MANSENMNKNATPFAKTKIKVYTKKKSTGDTEEEYIKKLKEKYENVDFTNVQTFSELPLSAKTLKGLKESGYTKPTDIQREALGLSLQGKDILGAAQTGSGKTLAFLIPILEVLFCKQWSRLDGVGALVITPTRELAYQIFETLRKVGKYHDFSAGLIIGGKDLKFERKRLDQCNIIICTPGRLLQHMDENPLFDCVHMQVLVLDEADRCLDMGFAVTMNAIIANLPPKRQTLLFSATQTKSVKDLARLSLKDPSYVSVHENSQHSTPNGLIQSYSVCSLENKVSIIWSFIRNHLKQKCIIFFSSCKEVKYMYEIFCKLRPGSSLLALYGTLHQLRRMNIYESFCRKSSAILFATDLAARGLDFPEVHWVVQADCPEDTDTYIHRVGRTARYHRGGESLLILLPSELAIVEDLEKRKIPISNIEINPIKLQNPVRKMEAFLARDPALKDTAQRAFVSYAKSVFLMKNKNIFNLHALDTDAYAKSLGLAIPPRIRFLQRFNSKIAQNKAQFVKKTISESKVKIVNENVASTTEEIKEESESELSDEEQPTSQKDPAPFNVSDDSDDGGILTVKRRDHDIELPSEQDLLEYISNKSLKKKVVSKAAAAKKILRKKIAPNKKIIFNDEGDAMISGTKEKQSEMAQQYENENEGGIDIEKAKLVLREEDKFDKQLFKEKVKAKHKEAKRKLKEKKREEAEQEQDDFGSESDGDEPDLSWLPDPDVIYGKKKNEDMESNDDDEEKLIAAEKSNLVKSKQKSKKRKPKLKEKHTGPAKKMKKEIGSSLSVNEAEELAMMLLKNK